MARIPRGLPSSPEGVPSKSYKYTFKRDYDDKQVTVTASSLEEAFFIGAQLTDNANHPDHFKATYILKSSTQPNSRSQYVNEKKETARVQLKEILPQGSTVYTILRSRASSGMYRVIDMVYVDKRDGRIYRVPASLVEDVTAGSLKYDPDKEGYGLSGAGMDMGFDLVYRLSSAVYGHEHGNTESGAAVKEGPYALHQEWL